TLNQCLPTTTGRTLSIARSPYIVCRPCRDPEELVVDVTRRVGTGDNAPLGAVPVFNQSYQCSLRATVIAYCPHVCGRDGNNVPKRTGVRTCIWAGHDSPLCSIPVLY